MSFDSRLIHELTVYRTPLDDDVADRDDYGQPTPAAVTTRTVRGLVQPISARELADSRSAGSEVYDHRIYLSRIDLIGSDAIEFDGDRYEVVGIDDYRFGSSPHLEVRARRVLTPVVAGSASGAS